MKLPFAFRNGAAKVIRGMPVRILTGPNRGLKWSLASTGRGALLGTFERQRVAALTTLLQPGDRVWDIGAHKGFLTMEAARAVGPAGRVTAFEPSSINLWFLRRHVEWNGLDNIRVVPVAVSDHNGRELFGGKGSSIAFQLGKGSETVEARTFSSLIEHDGLTPPDVIKIDVEGGEAAVLRGAAGDLSDEMLIFISIHSRPLYEECRAILLDRGYGLIESGALAACLSHSKGRWKEDPELLAVGTRRAVPDHVVSDLGLFAI